MAVLFKAAMVYFQRFRGLCFLRFPPRGKDMERMVVREGSAKGVLSTSLKQRCWSNNYNGASGYRGHSPPRVTALTWSWLSLIG